VYEQVIRVASTHIAVQVNMVYNGASSQGLYRFNRNELEIIGEEEREDIKMNENTYKNIAIVHIVGDYNNKDYGFALYDEEKELINKSDVNYPVYLVVNARGKDNKVLGKLKEIKTVEEYGKGVTAQVVGVVNMDAYNKRVAEEVRLKEIEKQRKDIEKELKAEIEKLNNIDLYEKMAKEHPENPRLAELVSALKELED
jgi:hypothetical protein